MATIQGSSNGIGGGGAVAQPMQVNDPYTANNTPFPYYNRPFSYAPQGASMQQRPNWMTGGWNGGTPPDPTQPPPAQPPAQQPPGVTPMPNTLPGRVPAGPMDTSGATPPWWNPMRGGVYNVGGASYPGAPTTPDTTPPAPPGTTPPSTPAPPGNGMRTTPKIATDNFQGPGMLGMRSPYGNQGMSGPDQQAMAQAWATGNFNPTNPLFNHIDPNYAPQTAQGFTPGIAQAVNGAEPNAGVMRGRDYQLMANLGRPERAAYLAQNPAYAQSQGITPAMIAAARR